MAKENENIILGRAGLDTLIKRGDLYGMETAAKRLGFSVRYLQLLCQKEKVPHKKLLGRYYMTPDQISSLLVTIPVSTHSGK